MTESDQNVQMAMEHVDNLTEQLVGIVAGLEMMSARMEQLTEMVQRVGESMVLAIQGTGDRLGSDFYHAVNRNRRDG